MARRSKLGFTFTRVEPWIREVCASHRQITLRALFYRLVAVYGFPNADAAYKALSRYVKRLRVTDPWLRERIIDPTRLPIIPKPEGVREVEVWLEKESIYLLLRELFDRYKVSVQIQRGYGSVSMYLRAVRRARRRGVKRILYFGDLDPSGLDIERVTRERMEPVEVERVALTWEQVGRYRLPPRYAKPSDRRTRRYVQRYGDPNCYEIEALDPRVLRRIAEGALRRAVPREELREIRLRERAGRIAERLLRPLRRRVERTVRELLERGLGPEEIRRRLRRMGLV
jgi:hypothetical protein